MRHPDYDTLRGMLDDVDAPSTCTPDDHDPPGTPALPDHGRDGVRSLQVDGPVATVTAGWEEREREDAELDEVLGGRSRNLGLFGRLTDVLDTDARFAAAALALRERSTSCRLYSLRLQRTLDSVYAVQRRTVRDDIAGAALGGRGASGPGGRRLVSRTVDQLYGELEMASPVSESEPVQRHRAEVAEVLGSAGALAIAGGHVGVLLRSLSSSGWFRSRSYPWSPGRREPWR